MKQISYNFQLAEKMWNEHIDKKMTEDMLGKKYRVWRTTISTYLSRYLVERKHGRENTI